MFLINRHKIFGNLSNETYEILENIYKNKKNIFFIEYINLLINLFKQSRIKKENVLKLSNEILEIKKIFNIFIIKNEIQSYKDTFFDKFEFIIYNNIYDNLNKKKINVFITDFNNTIKWIKKEKQYYLKKLYSANKQIEIFDKYIDYIFIKDKYDDFNYNFFDNYTINNKLWFKNFKEFIDALDWNIPKIVNNIAELYQKFLKLYHNLFIKKDNDTKKNIEKIEKIYNTIIKKEYIKKIEILLDEIIEDSENNNNFIKIIKQYRTDTLVSNNKIFNKENNIESIFNPIQISNKFYTSKDIKKIFNNIKKIKGKYWIEIKILQSNVIRNNWVNNKNEDSDNENNKYIFFGDNWLKHINIVNEDSLATYTTWIDAHDIKKIYVDDIKSWKYDIIEKYFSIMKYMKDILLAKWFIFKNWINYEKFKDKEIWYVIIYLLMVIKKLKLNKILWLDYIIFKEDKIKETKQIIKQFYLDEMQIFFNEINFFKSTAIKNKNLIVNDKESKKKDDDKFFVINWEFSIENWLKYPMFSLYDWSIYNFLLQELENFNNNKIIPIKIWNKKINLTVKILQQYLENSAIYEATTWKEVKKITSLIWKMPHIDIVKIILEYLKKEYDKKVTLEINFNK